MAIQKKCPITREEFSNQATAVKIIVDGKELEAEVKEFSTGSFGWYLNGKTSIKIGDKSIPVQLGINLTVVGSKEAS